MRKYIVGAVVGALLTFSFSALADSMIGKQVDSVYSLMVNGHTSDKNVIVIEGTSYLPVRAAGEMFGYTVSFENNTVKLSNLAKGEYNVQSDLFKVGGGTDKQSYVSENENDYLPIVVFALYETGSKGNYTVSIPSVGTTTDTKMIKNKVYVNLSSLGMKVQINGDTINVVKR